MSTGVPGFFGLKAESNFPPVIDSVTLKELSPGNGVLFGNQSFSVDVVMTNDGKPLADKALKAYIDGTFKEPVLTDYMTSTSFYQKDVGETYYAVNASGTEFNGGVGSPTTSDFVSVALFEERYNVGYSRLTQAHFLAVTDDNQLAYSSNGAVWEVRSAGITNAVFRKVQPLLGGGDYRDVTTGPPVFVACGQISGGDYFLATCDDNATFVVDLTLTEEVISLTSNYAGTATKLYHRASPQSDWQLIDSGNGPYQYRDNLWAIANGTVTNVSQPSKAVAAGITGGFDDLYDVDVTVSAEDSSNVVTGLGGVVAFDVKYTFPQAEQTSTTPTSSSQYYARVGSDAAWWARARTGALVSGGAITFDTKRSGPGVGGSIDSNATLTYARDVAFAFNSNLGVFVGNGGQIIYAVHEYSTVQFSSNLNFASIDKYDTLTLVLGYTERQDSNWFVLDKYTSTNSMRLLNTNDGPGFGGKVPHPSNNIRFRGGSTTTGATRRYLQMINYAGAYNNVQGLLNSDPGFTDQQTTGTDIPDIRFPATYADQGGFINRFEDVVQPGATFTVELKASNSSGSDTDSDTVTPG